MRRTPHYYLTDVDEVKRLIRENPWMTFVSATSNGIVASHYATLLEETDDDTISIVSHFGRPDEVAHELGQHEVMVIVQGPHGYISPGWYRDDEFIPTWNHVTAHLYGTPEILSADDNFRILHTRTDHFERPMPEPRSLHIDEPYAERVAKGTVGLRIRVSRFDARAKLSQNKPDDVRDRIIAELDGDGVYAHPGLAREMRRVHGGVEERDAE